MDSVPLLVDGIDVVQLPKVSLHDHLDGALRPATIIELAREAGLDLPTQDPEELGEWFAEKSDSGSLVEYLQTFDVTVGVLQSADALFRVAQEFVEDLVADGVVYAETRWAPEQHLTTGLSLEQAVEAVQSGLDAGTRGARRQGHEIEVNQILCALRQNERSLDIATLALQYRDAGVVGFDIAGPELGYPPEQHQAAFDLLAQHYFPVTVHAGEAAGPESIAQALFFGRAQRLGHGTHLIDDIDLAEDDDGDLVATCGDLAAWVRDRGIAIEACPSSNLQTGALEGIGDDIADHPLDVFYQLDFNVSVHVDNRLQSATTLSEELFRVADAFDYGLDDLAVLTLNAAESAFLPSDERQALADRIIAAYDQARAESDDLDEDDEFDDTDELDDED